MEGEEQHVGEGACADWAFQLKPSSYNFLNGTDSFNLPVTWQDLLYKL